MEKIETIKIKANSKEGQSLLKELEQAQKEQKKFKYTIMGAYAGLFLTFCTVLVSILMKILEMGTFNLALITSNIFLIAILIGLITDLYLILKPRRI